MRVSVGGSLSNNVPITSGVPQGSVLGPLLFLIYVNYIGSSLTCKYMMFADDLKLFLHHPGDPSSPASAILQFNIDTLAATASSWGLKFAPGKCVHLCFRRGLGGPFNHEFPKDEEVQCKWIHLCKRDGEVNPSHARICSRHFEESAYERNIKYELLGLPVPSNQRRLNSGALPTLHMPTTSEGVASGAILEDTEERRIGKRQRLQDSDSTENADLSAEERGRTSGEHIQLSNCCHRTQLQSAYWKEQFDSACCKIDSMLHDRPVKYWQDEGICKALTLQSLSPKGYRYLREVIKLPLPSEAAEDLEEECSLSAMAVSALDWQEPLTEGQYNENTDDPCEYDSQGTTFEDEMETEGLKYLGGYIVHKFPQHQFLGSNVEKNDHTWISNICRANQKLMKPSNQFFEQ
ncbi:hypothetical protein Pmani_010619 [Petrolisthes manimaculis]|uniref:Uncharacterized protein n=1 Tax=Petrolisthes manimaculis TaxID=1843537 RepID=A0AAE1Q437_9EUCA|nr:hypothetical protein Pmani_010619 [Petrolisthes manimaculis]